MYQYLDIPTWLQLFTKIPKFRERVDLPLVQGTFLAKMGRKNVHFSLGARSSTARVL